MRHLNNDLLFERINKNEPNVAYRPRAIHYRGLCIQLLRAFMKKAFDMLYITKAITLIILIQFFPPNKVCLNRPILCLKKPRLTVIGVSDCHYI